MAKRHNFFTSCINCGFIVCDQDEEITSSLQCPYCNAALLLPMNADEAQLIGENESVVEAYRLKDKLLIFDKENTKRTHVFDAQADYYESANWLSEDEKKRIDDKERRRRAAKKNRGLTNKINIRFDLAGRKIIEYVKDNGEVEEGEDEEEEYEGEEEEDDTVTGLSYGNTGLQNQRGRAGEVYRLMKQRWGTATSQQVAKAP